MDILELIESKKIGRFFRAKGKIIVEEKIYHITQRAPGREKLFLEDSDYLYFLYLLKDILKDFGIDIYAFCLMSNHIHLLIYLREKNLDKAMGKLFQRYAIYFNYKYKRKGHVFCGPYRCSLCNSERYIIAASLYIHLNPLKAGIVNNLYDYRWSSLGIYALPPKKSFVKNNFILGILSSYKKDAFKKYQELLEECVNLRYKARLETSEEWVKVIRTISKKLENFFPKPPKYISETSLKSLEESIQELKKKRRITRPKERKALVYVIEQLQSRGFNIAEIAGILNISRLKVYRYVTHPILD